MALDPDPAAQPRVELPLILEGKRDWYRHGILGHMHLEGTSDSGLAVSTHVIPDNHIELFGRKILARDHELLLAIHQASDPSPEEPLARWSVDIHQAQSIRVDPPEAGGGRFEWNGLQMTVFDDSGARIASIDRPDPLAQRFRFWERGAAIAEARPRDGKTMVVHPIDPPGAEAALSPSIDPRLLLGWILSLVLHGQQSS